MNETPLSGTHDRLSLALSAASVGAWDWDTEKGTVWWDSTMQSLFGLPEGEFNGQFDEFLSLVHPGDRESILARLKEAAEKQAPFNEQFRSLAPADGTVRQIRLRLRPLPKPEGSGVRMIGCGWSANATDAGAMSPAERTQLTMLMEHLPDHIYFKDLDSRFIAVNRSMAEWVGYDSPDALVGKTDHDLFTKEHAARALDDERAIMSSGIPLVDREEKETWPDREDTWVATTKMPLRDQSGAIVGTFGLSRDITERKRATSELKEFAYVVSHDLKAPLRGIASLAAWLATDYKEKLDESGAEILGLLQSRVKRMNDLIDGILQLSQVGARKGEPVETDLNAMVRDIIDAIAPPDGIHISIRNPLPILLCEPTRVFQIFQNLISNAVKHLGKPEGSVVIGADDAGESWRFSVTDDGVGIDPKYHGKIFQIFETLRPKDESQSTGIGLSVVKKIVEQYGGKIWVDSQAGQGATFFFLLPKRPQK